MSTLRTAIVFAVIAAAMGCAENRAAFFIQQVQVPTAECTVTSEETSYRTAGVVDVAFRRQYHIFPLLRNQLAPTENPENFVSETNGIQVEGANIRIWRGGRPQGSPFYTFYQPAASYVHPGNVSASSFTGVPEQAISALLQFSLGVDDANQLTFGELAGYQDLITVGITMLGITNGNQDVETPEFYFPVNLCFGCLLYCSVSEEGQYCPIDTEATPPCLVGQDEPTDCRWSLHRRDWAGVCTP